MQGMSKMCLALTAITRRWWVIKRKTGESGREQRRVGGGPGNRDELRFRVTRLQVSLRHLRSITLWIPAYFFFTHNFINIHQNYKTSVNPPLSSRRSKSSRARRRHAFLFGFRTAFIVTWGVIIKRYLRARRSALMPRELMHAVLTRNLFHDYVSRCRITKEADTEEAESQLR